MDRTDVYLKLHAGLSEALFNDDREHWRDACRLLREGLDGRASLPVRGRALADAVLRTLSQRTTDADLLRENWGLIAELSLEILALSYEPEAEADFDPIAKLFDREPVEDYVARVAKELPAWPRELLVEWLHRHAHAISSYRWLGFERLSFRLEEWPTDRLPGTEAMVGGAAEWEHVLERAPTFEVEWVARDIRANGTWNTPIVLLSNADGGAAGEGKLNEPWHLLEGHHRLAYVLGLRRVGWQLAETHKVYVATVDAAPSSRRS